MSPETGLRLLRVEDRPTGRGITNSLAPSAPQLSTLIPWRQRSQGEDVGKFETSVYESGSWTDDEAADEWTFRISVHDSDIATVDYRPSGCATGHFFLGFQTPGLLRGPCCQRPDRSAGRGCVFFGLGFDCCRRGHPCRGVDGDHGGRGRCGTRRCLRGRDRDPTPHSSGPAVACLVRRLMSNSSGKRTCPDARSRFL